jgi:hypothetical protein
MDILSRRRRRTITEETDELTLTQIKVLFHLKEESEKQSNEVIPVVLNKLKRLGFSNQEELLINMLDWIEHDAPIIIHFHRNTLIKFCTDNYYRNLFEMSAGTGVSSRVSWENKLFNTYYGNSTSNGFERVKYGVLNLFNSKSGVSSARSYGDCYLVLKKSMRERVSCTSGDSCIHHTVGTLDHYCHILNEFQDKELNVLATSFSKGVTKSMLNGFRFKEIQIHGPVNIHTDVLELVIPSNSMSSDVKSFQNIYTHIPVREYNINSIVF